MGFYLRKSVKVGLFRVNLSKRGIGVSTGIPGLRLGTGPRGTYVHMGRGGVYYRQYLSQRSLKANGAMRPSFLSNTSAQATNFVPVEQLPPIDASSDSDPLVQEIINKRSQPRYFSAVAFASIAVIIWLVSVHLNAVAVALISASAIVGCIVSSIMDTHRRTPVYLFDLDPDVEAVYGKVCDVFDGLARCGAVWGVQNQSVSDWKRNAGATSLIDRQTAIVARGAPQGLSTNIDAPYVRCGYQTVYFFPSEALIEVCGRIARAIQYRDLECTVDSVTFREEGTLPHDAEVVGQTWLKVNRDGSRDRRFSNNRQVPILRYGVLRLKDKTGWSVELETSSRGAPQKVPAALALLNLSHTEDGAAQSAKADVSVTLTLSFNGPTEKIDAALAAFAASMRKAIGERQVRYNDVASDAQSADNATPDLSSTNWVTQRINDARALVDELMACTKAENKLEALEQHYPACLDDILTSLATIRALRGDTRWHRTVNAFTHLWTALYDQLVNWPSAVDAARAALGSAQQCELKLAVKPDFQPTVAAYAADAAEGML